MNIPHKGFVNVRIQSFIQPLETNGKISGHTIKSNQKSFLFEVNGTTSDECSTQTQQLQHQIEQLLIQQNPTLTK